MSNNYFEKMADYIVKNVVKIKPEEKVLIKGHHQTKPLLLELIDKVYAQGGYPAFEMLDEDLYKSIMKNATEQSYDFTVKNANTNINNADVVITIFAVDNDYEFGDIDNDKVQMVSGKDFEYIENMVTNKRWLLYNYPNYLSAYKAKMSLDDFTKMSMRASSFDFGSIKNELNLLKDMLDSAKSVSIKTKYTDLHFDKEGIGSVLCTGINNLPDGEIYTSPVLKSVNGHIKLNTTSYYQGEAYNNIYLEFINGKVVSCDCEGDKEKLESVLNIDEGASSIGEFAIGLNPYVKKPIGDTLYDEKIRSSIHIALGNAFPDCADNGNRSSIHWDLVLMLNDAYGGGEVYLDDTLLIKDGLFVGDRLKELNKKYT